MQGRGKFRASQIMLERAEANPKINVLTRSSCTKSSATNKWKRAGLKNLERQETINMERAGEFVAIGHQPNASVLEG